MSSYGINSKMYKRRQNHDLPLPLVFHLHLDDGEVAVRHCCHDGNMFTFINDTGIICWFTPDKCFVCIIVHLRVKFEITFSADVKDSHCKPVLVLVEIIGHREHDSDFLRGLLRSIVAEVVSENTNRSARRVGSLAELGSLTRGGSDGK